MASSITSLLTKYSCTKAARQITPPQSHRINGCADTNVAAWCVSRLQQLNGNKSEIAWFGSRASQQVSRWSDSDTIKSIGVVRDLGV
jgi:hypothetical protein